MKIIIDNKTNKILRYGKNVQTNIGEYLIERDVDFSAWKDYEIYFRPIRGTFEKGDHKKFKEWLKKNDSFLQK